MATQRAHAVVRQPVAAAKLPAYQARLQPDQLADIINFDENAALLLKTAVEQSHLSARAYHKIQRVARTIADLNAEALISRATIAEALAYRAMPLLA